MGDKRITFTDDTPGEFKNITGYAYVEEEKTSETTNTSSWSSGAEIPSGAWISVLSSGLIFGYAFGQESGAMIGLLIGVGIMIIIKILMSKFG